jgi:hypothetical protein
MPRLPAADVLLDPKLTFTPDAPDWQAHAAGLAHAVRGQGVRCLAEVAPQPLHWLWPGGIPSGKLTVLDGDPGLGKSTLLLDLVARLTTARPLPDASSAATPPSLVGKGDGGLGPASASAPPPTPDSWLPTPANVLLLSAEDSLADTILPRLSAAGADLERVFCLSTVEVPSGPRLPRLPDDLYGLSQAIRAADASLVVVDPLVAFLSKRVDAYRDQDVRGALAPLALLAEQCGTALVVVRHLSKLPSRNPLYRGGGSIGIVGAARAALLVARDPTDPSGQRRILAPAKANVSALASSLAFRLVGHPSGHATVAWDGPSSLTAADLLVPPPPDEERDALDEATTILRDLLAAGPRPAQAIAQQAREAGLGASLLRRARAALGIRSMKEGSPTSPGQRWLWRLSDPAASPPEGAEGAEDVEAVASK